MIIGCHFAHTLSSTNSFANGLSFRNSNIFKLELMQIDAAPIYATPHCSRQHTVHKRGDGNRNENGNNLEFLGVSSSYKGVRERNHIQKQILKK